MAGAGLHSPPYTSSKTDFILKIFFEFLRFDSMQHMIHYCLFSLAVLFSCAQTPSFENSLINKQGKTIESRFLLPEGFERTSTDKNSFAHYLRSLELKPDGSKVKYYNGEEKTKNVYDAVINLPIGSKDLHQCADAVMRLRADYLYSQKQFDKIHFNLTNGFNCEYKKWMEGKRVSVKGNNTSWYDTGKPSNDEKTFWKYLEFVFSYAGSLSLSKELIKADVKDIKSGDVFIRGGSPGHAVIVVDMAEDKMTRKKIFLLAQSYMPAQETQILKNLNDHKLSPWYSTDFGEELQTPEWDFSKSELMRFKE